MLNQINTDSTNIPLAVQDITRWIHDYVDNDDQLLVREIQNRVLPRRGLWVSTDQILITVGVQNALYLLARLLVNKGDNVGFENPGSPDARNIFEFRDCNLTPLDVDENGMVVDDRIGQCDVVYCTPSCQSPTTVTMSLERREKLLQCAAENDFLIIEDDYEGDLNFTGTEIPALRSLDSNERVIYVGSLSKTLAPGLRLGYMVAQKELINEARALRRLMFRHPSSNNQNAVAHFLSRGYHELLVRRLAAEYKERWQVLNDSLKEYMPDSGQAPSFGGSAFWVKLRAGSDANAIAAQAKRNGIWVVSGDNYYMKPDRDHSYLRIGFSSIPVDKIRDGIKKLAHLVETFTVSH